MADQNTKKGYLMVAIAAAVVALCMCGHALTLYFRYNAAAQDLAKGSYAEAREAFSKLGDYGDAQEMVLECTYAEIEDLFLHERYERICTMIDEGALERDYKDIADIYAICTEKIEQKKYEEDLAVYERTRDAYENKSTQSFWFLEYVIEDAERLAAENFDGHRVNLERIANGLRAYFSLSEKIYEEYGSIAYEFALSMTDKEIEQYAQKTLSKKYKLPKEQIQHIFESYHEYVARGGKYVNYNY